MTEIDLEARRAELDSIGLALRDGVERHIRKRRRRLHAIAAASCVGLVSAAAVTGLTGSGSDTSTPAAASVLHKAAQAASFEPGPIPPGRFLYFQRVGFLQQRVTDPHTHLTYRYDLRTSSEEWVAHDYSALSILPGGVATPEFPTEQDRRNWEASGSPPLKPRIEQQRSESRLRPGFYRDVLLFWAIEPPPSRDLLRVYGLSARQLSAAAGSQRRFNDLVRGHIAAVTQRLSRRGAARAQIARDTDGATFSLVLNLIAHSRTGRSPHVRAALLNLAASLRSISVDPDFTDRLGRRGIAVHGKSVPYELVVFDPETFVIVELRLGTKRSTPVADGEPVATGAINDFRYELVDRERERP